MTKQGFSNELERALARPDSDELVRKLRVHQRFSADEDEGVKSSWTEECDFVITAGTPLSKADDPEITIALVALAAANFDDTHYLALIAAGPLENLLRTHDGEMLERVAIEARRSARFRWMLSGVFLHAIHPDNVDVVKAAIGDMSMDKGAPLPPRPWA